MNTFRWPVQPGQHSALIGGNSIQLISGSSNSQTSLAVIRRPGEATDQAMQEAVFVDQSSDTEVLIEICFAP